MPCLCSPRVAEVSSGDDGKTLTVKGQRGERLSDERYAFEHRRGLDGRHRHYPHGQQCGSAGGRQRSLRRYRLWCGQRHVPRVHGHLDARHANRHIRNRSRAVTATPHAAAGPATATPRAAVAASDPPPAAAHAAARGSRKRLVD